MNRTDLDHRLTRLREPLVVPAVPPVSAQPGESSFHHPAPRQLHVSDTPGRTTDDLDHIPSPGLHQPALEVAIVVLPVVVRPQNRTRCIMNLEFRKETHPHDEATPIHA